MSSCRQAKALFAGRYPATPIACTFTLHIGRDTQQQAMPAGKISLRLERHFMKGGVGDLLTDAESWRGTASWCGVTSVRLRHGQGIQ